MATLFQLKEETYDFLATKAARFTGFLGNGDFTLAEALPVWTVLPDNWDIRSFYPTSDWHVQVRNGDAAIAYLRARIFGPRINDWEVSAVFNSSQLALGVDTAMEIFDSSLYNDITENAEGRLLEIPYYQMVALWIHSTDNGEDYFIFCYLRGPAGERNNPIMTGEQFTTIMRDQPIIRGRIDDDDEPEAF